MRKINLKKWKAMTHDGKDIEEDLISVLTGVLSNKKQEELPRGFENFRMMNRIANAFDKSKKDGILILEESDYKFLLDGVIKDIPSLWGMNNGLFNEVNSFIDSKQEEWGDNPRARKKTNGLMTLKYCHRQ